MLQIEGYENIHGEWLDGQLVTILACEEVREVHPSNPVFDKTQQISLPLVLNPPSHDYGEFAFSLYIMLPVSNDERDEDLTIAVLGDFHYAPGDDEDERGDLEPLTMYVAMFDENEDPLMIKDIRRKGIMKKEPYMKVLPEFYATGHTDEDLKRWGIIV